MTASRRYETVETRAEFRLRRAHTQITSDRRGLRAASSRSPQLVWWRDIDPNQCRGVGQGHARVVVKVALNLILQETSMRMPTKDCLALIAVLALAAQARADDRLVLGNDVYATGTNTTLSEPSIRDALVAGFSVEIDGTVDKSAHAMGFDVDVDAPIGQNLYAGGFSVKVEKPVGEDLTAAGFNVRILRDASVGGNARLAAGTLLVDAPISGSLVAAAGTLTLNSTVAGDARLSAMRLKFGPDARIGGTLTYSAPEMIEIAPSVIAPEKVHFQRVEMHAPMSSLHNAMRRSMPHLWPSLATMFIGFAMTLAFLLLIAAVLLALLPEAVEKLRCRASARPFQSIGLGVLGLGALVGLVPVVAMTLIGIPLIPILVLAIVSLWTVGYLLGAYVLSWRVATALGQVEPSLAIRLTVIAAGLVVLALLNFTPVVGWLINLIVVFLGLGGMVDWTLHALIERRPPKEPPVPDQETSGGAGI